MFAETMSAEAGSKPMRAARTTDDGEDRARAIAAARRAAVALAAVGVQTLVTGSLARGGFTTCSDIDLLVTACPRHLKYAIEGMVEDIMGGIPFDVIYLDDLPPWRVPSFMRGAVDAVDLG